MLATTPTLQPGQSGILLTVIAVLWLMMKLFGHTPRREDYILLGFLAGSTIVSTTQIFGALSKALVSLHISSTATVLSAAFVAAGCFLAFTREEPYKGTLVAIGFAASGIPFITGFTPVINGIINSAFQIFI